ncbi:DUF4153 domain-containing protein [Pseudomonas sp.]|uniref:DUF4153 domain-containing protein n=1 Tax=Pseudomonas sp. TaxID=306 RepID=UPI0028AA3422|nr:DUF4153 domain-containing protein [Pseudomonas sp.]
MSEPQRPLMFHLVIGLLQGLLLVLFLSSDAPATTLGYFTCAAAAVWAVVLQLLGPHGLRRSTLLMALGLGALVGGLSAYSREAMDVTPLRDTLVLGMLVLSYMATAFILAWADRKGLRPRYEDLVRHAWNNVFIVLLALLLVGVFWALLAMCGALFKVVGITLVEQALDNRILLMLVLPMVFSLGMRIGLQNEKVISLLRGLLLAACRFLLPLSATIAVMFTLVLPFTGVAPIWATGQASAILLALTVFNLFLVNGVFQDGPPAATYPKVLRRLADASLLVSPILVALAGWSSGVRIAQYGLTPLRLLAVLLVGLMLLHTLAAAWAVLDRRGSWLSRLRVSNPWVALLTGLMIVAYQSPLLDPLGLSARNQVARVLDGRTPVADFNADALLHLFGAPGREAFEGLERQLEAGTVLDEPGREALRQRLQAAREPNEHPAAPKLEWLGAEPGDSTTVIERILAEWSCREGCYLWALDMDGDGHDEVLAIPRQRYTTGVLLFALREGVWVKVGQYDSLSLESDHAELVKKIRAGEIAPVTPRYKTFMTDQREWMFQPEP